MAAPVASAPPSMAAAPSYAPRGGGMVAASPASGAAPSLSSVVPEWMSAEHDMGTSIMAVAFDGGVVMGADSRTSTGQYIANRVSDKITPVFDNIYVCRSGSAADTQAISSYVKWFLQQHALEIGERPTVAVAANLFRQMVYQNKHLMAGLIVAGYDDVKGGQVFSIPLGGSLLAEPFAIGGSGSTYVYGHVDAQFKENMTAEQCEEFVRNTLALAMSRDGSSGGVIRTCTITKDGVTRKMVPGNELPRFWEGGEPRN